MASCGADERFHVLRSIGFARVEGMGRGSRPVRRWRHDRKKRKAAREKRSLAAAAVARPSRR